MVAVELFLLGWCMREKGEWRANGEELLGFEKDLELVCGVDFWNWDFFMMSFGWGHEMFLSKYAQTNSIEPTFVLKSTCLTIFV